MSRVALPAEKVLAIKSIYGSLIEELGLLPPIPVPDPTPGMYLATSGPPTIEYTIPVPLMVALIDAATRVAMGTDTRDLGIMGEPKPLEFPKHPITCGLCPWGRTPPNHSEDDYYDHVNKVHGGHEE